MEALDRRHFLALGASAVGAALPSARRAGRGDPPPVRTITRGPRHHWFGYYDKLQFDPSDRFVLGNEVAFEHRTPAADDAVRVGMVDLVDGDAWIELGESRAWCWQQGCMLQWRPGSAREVLWNDRVDGRFVCRVRDVEAARERTLPSPIYAVSPDGRFGLSVDFARLQVMRPGYGYVGVEDPHGDELAPKDGGVVRVDLDSGARELVLSLADIAAIPHQGERLTGVWHYFNHVLISPDAQRFVVLHRWRALDPKTGRPRGGFRTRMITAATDGGAVYVLNPAGLVSHFIWRDPEHVCMWTKPEGQPPGFYLYEDQARAVRPVGRGVMTRDGHNTYLPGRPSWILCDTYPDRQRRQRPYLLHVPTGKKHELGAFHLPPSYRGEWRCDLHPRASNDGRLVCIDSPHLGGGRQMHVVDVSAIVVG